MTSEKYSELLNQIKTISDENNLKDYRAFVYWFIETCFEGYEKQKILDSICDGAHDKGIDAIIINDIERTVVIIQSKFEREGGKAQIKDSEVKLLATVRDYFKSRRGLEAATRKANQVISRLINDAFAAIHSKNYTLQLIFITTHKKAPQTEELIRDTLGFKPDEFSVWDYGEIMYLFAERLRGSTPPLGHFFLSYKDSDKYLVRITNAKYKSWVLTVPLDEIRTMVNSYRDRLFRKNVRNFLGKNICNKGVLETLENYQDSFWYFNNGICILCDEGNLEPEKNRIRLVNPQIINGCQTARTIEKFKNELSGEILVRIVESKDHEFVNTITLFQNTSNPVRKRDLKSNDPIQIRLKNEFMLKKWYYEIKRGEEFKKMTKKHPSMKQFYKSDRIQKKVIDNEDVAKVLAAIKISPAIAISKGSEDFFDDFYNTLFTSTISTINCLAPWSIYRIIRNSYSKERFHKFKKGFVFKNPASFYVLKFIYESFENHDKWEKDFVSFYEEPSLETFYKFERRIKKIISEYFEIIYNMWKESKQPDHRTYLQNPEIIKEIRSKNKRKLNRLSTKFHEIFKLVK